MRIPISENEEGVIWTSRFDKNYGSFARIGTWSYDYGITHGFRKATWKEFLGLYPYQGYRRTGRYKIWNKNIAQYNKEK